ncbi:MAG TPA: tetratricopeptide repeat protein, partial [Planctomycetota bacterium]|nr:tetratricopeptide repeat protein [Planctomycetota bacterium]
LFLLQTEQRPPTFTRDVAPILWQHCATCHRPGEVGPFALLTYADAKKRAAQIVERVDAGAMPPWIPTSESLPFQGERRLSEAEKSTLRAWLASGVPEGEPAELPPPPIFPAGWQTGTPDLVVEMPESFALEADGPDLFRNFVVPTAHKEARWIRAIEVRPDNARVLHHAEVLVDKTGSARRLDLREPGVGFEGQTAGQAAKPDGFFLGWTPGKLAREHPAGLAWRLPPGADLVLQAHLVHTGKPETLRVKIGLWFAASPPTRRPVLARLGSTLIDLPAGDASTTIEDQYVLPVSATLLGLYPHAHFLAKQMRADAVFADGRRIAVLRIDDWDFNWQDEYRLQEPLALPAGARLEMRYTYDNSSANPRNPALVPRRVLYGPNSSDEMGDLWLALLAQDEASTKRLEQELARKDFFARKAGSELGVKLSPDSARAHMQLGSMLQAEGQLDRAAAEFRRALELDHECADAQFNLGVLAFGRQDMSSALKAFEAALAISPFYPEAWNNRGTVKLAQQDFPAAAAAFQKAIEQFPAYADGHSNLGLVKARTNDFVGARASLERALAIDPEHVEATFCLGNVSLQTGDATKAVSLYRKTLTLAPNHVGAKTMLERIAAAGKKK